MEIHQSSSSSDHYRPVILSIEQKHIHFLFQQKYQQRHITMYTDHYLSSQPQKKPEKSMTQSQMMNNLNFSIEDLLQKISKVTDNYEPSMEGEVEMPPLMFGKSRPKKEQFRGEKAGDSTLATEITSKYSACNSSKQNMATFDQLSFTKNGYRSYNPPEQPGYLSYSTPHSLREIHQSPLSSLKKINSLFCTESVREVAESRIISNQEEQPHCQYNLADQFTQSLAVSTIIAPDTTLSEPAIKLSDFELGKSVGSGKFGQVYLCRHKKTGLLFALKKLFKSDIRQNQMQSQFALQLKILYHLNHPNIIKLYSHFQDEYHVFLLMEYIEGGELISKLGSCEEYVSKVVAQMMDCVDYMHQQGVVHRDIKPENIVIAFENTVKLCDFGWAGLFLPHSMKTTFCGTLDYVSPEMKDKGHYDCKVDIWSIGVLTFELLTKEAPFKEEIAHWKRKGGKRQQQWDWNILYPPSLSAIAQSFMRNLLKQSPQDRASLRYCKQHFFIRKYQSFNEESLPFLL